jgi:hypothetical protein
VRREVKTLTAPSHPGCLIIGQYAWAELATTIQLEEKAGYRQTGSERVRACECRGVGNLQRRAPSSPSVQRAHACLPESVGVDEKSFPLYVGIGNR